LLSPQAAVPVTLVVSIAVNTLSRIRECRRPISWRWRAHRRDRLVDALCTERRGIGSMPIQKAGGRFRKNASDLALRARPFGATRSKIDFAFAGDTTATMYRSTTGGQGSAA